MFTAASLVPPTEDVGLSVYQCYHPARTPGGSSLSQLIQQTTGEQDSRDGGDTSSPGLEPRCPLRTGISGRSPIHTDIPPESSSLESW